MDIKYKHSIVRIKHGNIVNKDADAMVNATGSSLIGGDGVVDNAIHIAAGQ